ncbi:MAG: histidine phosphatase family protein [Chloroflexi bacterium]|nr:histidine phosphatase family protein [Chloroflexota bacterium]
MKGEQVPTQRSVRVELYLLRHAHAGDPAAWRGPDEDRPLSVKGRKQSKRLGTFLADGGFRPDAILSSPKLRAVQTAKVVARELRAKVHTNARLASDVSLEMLERVLDEAPGAQRVVVVGHDPDFSDLLSLLSGTVLELAKGALARIDIDRPLRPGRGELRWLVPPDALRTR